MQRTESKSGPFESIDSAEKSSRKNIPLNKARMGKILESPPSPHSPYAMEPVSGDLISPTKSMTDISPIRHDSKYNSNQESFKLNKI